jgi:hypothetical protein
VLFFLLCLSRFCFLVRSFGSTDAFLDTVSYRNIQPQTTRRPRGTSFQNRFIQFIRSLVSAAVPTGTTGQIRIHRLYGYR